MKLAIIGSRGFNDINLLNETLNPLIFVIDLVISGGDKMGEEWAERHGINTLIFPAEWDNLNKNKAL